MQKYEGQKTFMIVNGIFHIAFILILSLLIYSLPAPAFGSTDIPVKANTTPVALGAAALFTGFGGGAGMTNQAIFTVANGDMGPTAASTLLTGFHVYTETPANIETVNGTTHSAPQCEDMCILSM